MNTNTTKTLSDEVIEQYKSSILNMELASTTEFINEVIANIPYLENEDLIQCSLWRIPNIANKQKKEFICDLDIFQECSAQWIAENYGGGNFQVIWIFFRYKDPEGLKKVILTKKTRDYQIDKSWDLKNKHKADLEALSQSAAVASARDDILKGKSNSNSDFQLSFIMEELKHQRELNRELILKLNTNQNQNNGPFGNVGIIEIITLLKELSQPSNLSRSPLEEKLLEKAFENMNNSTRNTGVSELIRMKKELTDLGIIPQEKTDDTLTEIKEAFLPIVGDVASQLLSKRAAAFPSQVQKKLAPYQNHIETINKSDELKREIKSKLKNEGFTEEQLNTVQERSKLDLSYNEVEGAQNENKEVFSV